MNWSNISGFFTTDASITLLALASAFTGALYLVCMSQTMKKNAVLSSIQVLAFSHLTAAAALLPFLNGRTASVLFQGNVLYLLCMTAGFLLVSRMLYFYAYAHTDVANVAIFSPLTPVYVLAVGYAVLGETVLPRELLGLLIISISIYFYFLPKISGFSDLILPFALVFSSAAMLCAFLSTIPTAFAAVFQKKLLLEYMSPVDFSFWLLFAIGLLASVVLVAKKQVVLPNHIKQFPLTFFIASAVLLPLTHVLFSWLVLEKSTALALVLQRTGILFQMILAYLIMKERKDIGKRLVVAGVIMLGFYLIICSNCSL